MESRHRVAKDQVEGPWWHLQLRAVRRLPMVRNTASMFVSTAGKTALQALFFLLLARELGIDEFGAFSGVVALVAVLQPFGSLGSINLLIMHVSVDRTRAAQEYATALAVTVISGAAMAMAIVVAAPAVLPSSITRIDVACICVADLLGARLVDVAAAAFQAQGRMTRAAAFPVFVYGSRVVGGLGLFVGLGHASLGQWAIVYLVASGIVCLPILVWSAVSLGIVSPRLSDFGHEWRLGVHFSISLASQTVYNDIDKAMLANLSTLSATGLYAAAYRVIDMAFTPMRAMLAAAYPRFFRHGVDGLPTTIRFTRRLAIPALIYCSTAALILLAAAGLLPVILGPSFVLSEQALRELSALLILKAVHYLAADALTGAGLQRLRSRIQVGIALLNVGLNLWLIPLYSWRGAVVSSLFSDGFLALSLWFVVGMELNKDRASRELALGAATA